jgi:capsular exopolysaccharide synthesis family protein
MINFSELLWRPQRVKGPPSSGFAEPASQDLRDFSELRQIQAEEVRIRPELRIANLTDARSPGADRFRFLRMKLRELKAAVNLTTLLITSPLPHDGKSTIALNLATVLAEEGKRRVLLIEADLYHPTLAQRLEVPIRPGLGECLEKGLDPMSALRRLEPLGWYLLEAGGAKGNPTELLQSELFPNVLQRLSPHFEWILIDTPPVAPLTDAVSISRHADASLLVVRAGCTPQESVREALAALGQKHVLGIIFNAAEGLNRVYSQYYGYYGKK